MMLTLFADASFCPKTGAAGWGSWAICDTWTKGKFNGGALRRKITSSTTAELCGIASALWAHDKAGDLVDIKAFMLQCDNVAALGYVLGRIPNASVKRLADIRQPIIEPSRTSNKLCIEGLDEIVRIVAGRTVMLRHIKGHSGTDDGRSWVNHQCDREARRHMQARRIELEAAA